MDVSRLVKTRRDIVLQFSTLFFAGVAAITGLYSTSTKSLSQESKKPTISQTELQKGTYQMVSGVYDDAKKLGFPLKENYVKEVYPDILLEVRSIAERHFVVQDQ
jgi:hypothetical protein